MTRTTCRLLSELVTGMFTEHCMVVAEGHLQNKVFVVDTLVHSSLWACPACRSSSSSSFFFHLQGFPPVETRADSLKAHPVLQPYSDSERKQLAQLAKAHTAHHDMIAVLSDVHLDKPRV